MTPSVSIILPTYNRAKFLPAAFESICAQTYQDWELIIVDDGSTDETRQLVEEFMESLPQNCRYVYQENAGAYAARNRGLDEATGEYIAFFDSDDCWLPHHLQDCSTALQANPDVDWVYGPSKRIVHETGEVFQENTFYSGSIPHPHLKLNTEKRGDLHVISDSDTTVVAIESGLHSPLQNSLIRATVFDGIRFDGSKRNGGDQIMVIRALNNGARFGYFHNIQVTYTIHESNSSAAGDCKDGEKQKFVLMQLIAGLRDLLENGQWSVGETRAFKRRLGKLNFWVLGYGSLWMNGQRRDAIHYLQSGIRYWPWDWRCWKTYMLCRVRYLLGSSSGDVSNTSA